MSDEWIKTLTDRRRVKFTNQEMDEKAFLTAQIEGNKVVYSISLSNTKNPLSREEVETHFEGELSKPSQESLKLLRMLIDQSNDAIYVILPETLRVVDANRRACLDLGYTREELLSMSVHDIDPEVSKFGRIDDELRNSGAVIF